MAILSIRDANGNVQEILAIRGEKGDKGDIGNSGVFVGSGDMPNGYNVQIDPDGDSFVFSIDQAYKSTSGNAQSGKAVADALSNFYNKNEIDTMLGNVETLLGGI